MSVPTIRVTVRTPLTGADSSDPACGIIQKVQAIRQAVMQLREDNLEYERIRDQYIIHLQQCQEDHNILRQIFKTLRLKLDLASQEVASDAQTTTHAPTSIPQTRRIPTLENVRLTPVITGGSDSVTPSSVRLRLAVNTSSVICTSQFSPDGRRIAFADGAFVYIIQSSDGEVIATIALPGGTEQGTAHSRALKWSPSNKFIAVTGPSNDVLLYDAEMRRLVHTYEGHQKEVSSIVFNEDGSWLVTAGFDGLVFIWDVRTHANVKRLQHGQGGNEGAIGKIATTPDGTFYAVGFMSGSIGIYNEHFDEPMMSFAAHSQALMGLAVSPFDDTIATVSQDRSAKVWVIRGVASCKHTLTGHSDVVLSVAFSSKAPLMITGSKDQTLKMWQHKTGQLLCTLQAHRNTLFEINHHPIERSFVSCSGDGVVCVWDYDNII
jgi:WD40 repeat protein